MLMNYKDWQNLLDHVKNELYHNLDKKLQIKTTAY